MEKVLSANLKKLLEKAYFECRYHDQNDINNIFKKYAERYYDVHPGTKEEFLRICSPQDRIDIICFGFYKSIETNDFSILNDALYTYNRIQYLFNKRIDLASYSGSDSSFIFEVLAAYAGNDAKCAAYYIKKYGKYSKKGHRYTNSLANLIVGIINKDSEIIIKAVREAGIFLTRKNTIYDQAIIEYLLALIEKNYQGINTSFSAAINSYIKEKAIHQWFNNLYKYIPVQLFGLLKISEIYLGKDFYNHFQKPASDIWWDNYYEILKSGNTGKSLVIFDENIGFLNNLIREL